MGDIILDFERETRCGVDEAIFCESKTPEQITQIIEMVIQAEKRALLTRLIPEKWDALPSNVRQQLCYDEFGWTATLGASSMLDTQATVAVVSGGASDNRVCNEIVTTLNYHGFGCSRYEDVGVAALWRLNNRLDDIKKADIVIAVAGMEAALPTILCGLISNPIIAVPTSVGYGVAAGGKLALHALLGSCAAGITVVNIDNGFGAACAAVRMMKMANQHRIG
ncbi:nickel pincer cofactor biosynthesis protein LarB [Shewanella sp.]|uniref:nickel pincer cofactor biosynthesis protein LarB n=1 Tax=Shewanella sp. TaxID=50422 RepID=UPI003A9788EA